MSILPNSIAKLIGGDAGYDWRSEENYNKWRGIFVPSLQKVLTQVLWAVHNILYCVNSSGNIAH